MNSIKNFDNQFMQLACKQAELAFNNGEVPVGCVIVNNNTKEIVASSFNLVETQNNPNMHAEMNAINNACQELSTKNLKGHSLYVTLEPCTMCASAISNTRIDRIYYGAADEKHGAVENGVKFFQSKNCFHKPDIYPGIYSEESTKLLKEFFKKLR